MYYVIYGWCEFLIVIFKDWSIPKLERGKSQFFLFCINDNFHVGEKQYMKILAVAAYWTGSWSEKHNPIKMWKQCYCAIRLFLQQEDYVPSLASETNLSSCWYHFMVQTSIWLKCCSWNSWCVNDTKVLSWTRNLHLVTLICIHIFCTQNTPPLTF